MHPSMVGLAAYDSSKGCVLMFTKAFVPSRRSFVVET